MIIKHKKSVLLSGIQPTGPLHVGNYLGALKHFEKIQNDFDCYFMVADLHSLTENYNPEEKTKQIVNLVATFVAAGLDPKKNTLFLQSFVPEHTELAWIFNTITPISELERMTQYKDKAARQIQNINTGLFTYPILQAADILLYKAEVVPIGEDQTQHLELTRTVARKFNKRFGETFVPPNPLYASVPKLMSLLDPTRKMSKSEPTGCLFLEDPPEIVARKIGRAVTDTGPTDKKQMSPGIKNLFLLLESFGSEDTYNQFTKAYQFGKLNYKDLKDELAKSISHKLAPIQKQYKELIKQPTKLIKILEDGSNKASKKAKITLSEIKQKIGLPKQ